MAQSAKVLIAAAAVVGLAGCASETAGVRSDAGTGHGGTLQNRCAEAVARKVGVRAKDVVVKRSTISEGTGHHFVFVGVPRATADWVCEADRNGRVVDVYFGTEG